MSAGVLADTHAIVWYLANDARLSARAAAAFDRASAQGEPILIAAISLVELIYLVEKKRLPRSARERLLAAINTSESPLEVASLDLRIAAAVESIPRQAVPDLPDRVIAATALAYGVPLVTRDAGIRLSGLPITW